MAWTLVALPAFIVLSPMFAQTSEVPSGNRPVVYGVSWPSLARVAPDERSDVTFHLEPMPGASGVLFAMLEAGGKRANTKFSFIRWADRPPGNDVADGRSAGWNAT